MRGYGAPGSESITLVVVDDQQLIRDALTRSLTADGLKVAGEAQSGEQGVRLVNDLRPDVVLMDLLLPGISGVETIQRLSVLAPASRILVLTSAQERYGVVEAILAGACGYILKDTPPEEIVSAVRASAAGECVISPQIAGDLLDRVRERDIAVTARSEDAAGPSGRSLPSASWRSLSDWPVARETRRSAASYRSASTPLRTTSPASWPNCSSTTGFRPRLRPFGAAFPEPVLAASRTTRWVHPQLGTMGPDGSRQKRLSKRKIPAAA